MIHIRIKTANAAFQDDGWQIEVARILRELATKIENGEKPPLKLRDINGNIVGTFETARR